MSGCRAKRSVQPGSGAKKRVEVRLDVAGTTRVGVVAPRSAEFGRTLEHDEVIDTVESQTDRGAKAAKAASDDCDVSVNHAPGARQRVDLRIVNDGSIPTRPPDSTSPDAPLERAYYAGGGCRRSRLSTSS